MLLLHTQCWSLGAVLKVTYTGCGQGSMVQLPASLSQCRLPGAGLTRDQDQVLLYREPWPQGAPGWRGWVTEGC